MRWTRVDEKTWEPFLRLLPPSAEGCVVYLQEAGEFVKFKRTTEVLKMDRESTVVTHFSLQEIRATFAHQSSVMNQKLMCGAYLRHQNRAKAVDAAASDCYDETNPRPWHARPSRPTTTTTATQHVYIVKTIEPSFARADPFFTTRNPCHEPVFMSVSSVT